MNTIRASLDVKSRLLYDVGMDIATFNDESSFDDVVREINNFISVTQHKELAIQTIFYIMRSCSFGHRREEFFANLGESIPKTKITETVDRLKKLELRYDLTPKYADRTYLFDECNDLRRLSESVVFRRLDIYERYFCLSINGVETDISLLEYAALRGNPQTYHYFKLNKVEPSSDDTLRVAAVIGDNLEIFNHVFNPATVSYNAIHAAIKTHRHRILSLLARFQNFDRVLASNLYKITRDSIIAFNYPVFFHILSKYRNNMKLLAAAMEYASLANNVYAMLSIQRFKHGNMSKYLDMYTDDRIDFYFMRLLNATKARNYDAMTSVVNKTIISDVIRSVVYAIDTRDAKAIDIIIRQRENFSIVPCIRYCVINMNCEILTKLLSDYGCDKKNHLRQILRDHLDTGDMNRDEYPIIYNMLRNYILE